MFIQTEERSRNAEVQYQFYFQNRKELSVDNKTD